MASFDFKKAYKDLYQPSIVPKRIEVPAMTYITISGQGDPNISDGEYQAAMGILYSLCYTIKMSKMSGDTPDGYYDYVVPPLEGFWWTCDGKSIDFHDKSNFVWISLIRQPDFVTPDVFEWARQEMLRKKKIDCSAARLETIAEGLCVQCMHVGAFDDEPATIEKIKCFIENDGLANDISDARHHHEIYLGDPRKTAVSKRRTVLRIPVREK